ncbi:MAG: Recombination protein RecR [Planctomycetota bacterium]|jgi:recombination protein RecR
MASRHPSIERLIDELGRLPGIGPKSAERIAFFLLREPADDALGLAEAIREVRAAVRACSRCCNLDATDPCAICADDARDAGMLLVVEDSREIARFEETGYRGLYHVLQGRLSQFEGIRPEDLTTDELVARVVREKPREVCLATNPDLEGEGTARVLAERLAPSGVKVTRLARGLPAGASIAQVSKSILADAIEGRRALS